MIRSFLLPVVLLVFSASSLFAVELPLGMTVAGNTSYDKPAQYEITTDEPGVLTVVVRADNDITLTVQDSFGQPLPNGQVDLDYQGDTGAEQGAFVLGQGDTYTIIVNPLGGPSDFQIGATWLAMPQVEVPEDPQGRPSSAVDLPLDENVFEVIDESAGDFIDWYRFTAPSPGLLTIATRTREGDLVLSCYSEDDFNNPIDYSDQDLENDGGREQISIEVEEGDVYYFRINAYGSQAEYVVRAALQE